MYSKCLFVWGGRAELGAELTDGGCSAWAWRIEIIDKVLNTYLINCSSWEGDVAGSLWNSI